MDTQALIIIFAVVGFCCVLTATIVIHIMVNKFRTWKYDILESQNQFLSDVITHLENQTNHYNVFKENIIRSFTELKKSWAVQLSRNTGVNCSCRDGECCSDCPQSCTKSETCCADSDCCKNGEQCDTSCCDAVDNGECEVDTTQTLEPAQVVDTTQDNVKNVKPNWFNNKKKRR